MTQNDIWPMIVKKILAGDCIILTNSYTLSIAYVLTRDLPDDAPVFRVNFSLQKLKMEICPTFFTCTEIMENPVIVYN